MLVVAYFILSLNMLLWVEWLLATHNFWELSAVFADQFIDTTEKLIEYAGLLVNLKHS